MPGKSDSLLVSVDWDDTKKETLEFSDLPERVLRQCHTPLPFPEGKGDLGIIAMADSSAPWCGVACYDVRHQGIIKDFGYRRLFVMADAMTPDRWNRLLGSWSVELLSAIDRIDYLIGNKHQPTKGSYRETLLRRLIARVLPKRFRVSTGFVYRWHDDPSRQIDILIWDAQKHSALLEEDDLVILTADAVAAMIEVKSVLSPDKLRDALELLSPKWLTYWRHTTASSTSGLTQQVPNVPYRAVFAYDASQSNDNALALTVFKELATFYGARFGKDAERAMSQNGERFLNWTNLVDAICIARGPSFEQARAFVNCNGSESQQPAYVSLAAGELSVGRFCMHLLANLTEFEAGDAARVTLTSPTTTTTPSLCCFGSPLSHGTTRVRAWGNNVPPDSLWIPNPPLWEYSLPGDEAS